MITLDNVTKMYGASSVVESVTLAIKPGEIVGLLGPNGAGKTTTIRMIAGVLPPSKGSISVNGLTHIENSMELKSQIGYLPEDNPLYEDLTVEEHLYFWGRMKGLSPAQLPEAIQFALESTDITDVYYRFIGELSKGYRQRVGLAQAIMNKPSILLLDEPTEGLDPNQRRDIQALLAKLRKDRTVIVSSHVLGEISHLADRIIIIHKGMVVGDDSPQNLVSVNKKSIELMTEIKGSGVAKGLKEIPGVSKVVKEGTNHYRITAKKTGDIRETVFSHCVKHKWVLLEMRPLERQLEDVFSELTEQ